MPGTGKVIAAVIGGALFASVLTTTFFAFRKNQSEPRVPERPVVQKANPDEYEYLSDFKTGYKAGFEAGILGLPCPEAVGQRDGYIEGVNQGYSDGYNRLALLQSLSRRVNVRASVRRGRTVRRERIDPETGVPGRFVGALSGASIGAGVGAAIGGGKGAAVGAAVGSVIGALPQGGRMRGEEVEKVLRNAGIGAGVGGIIGGAIGGGRGAAAGSAIGAGAAALGTGVRQKSRR